MEMTAQTKMARLMREVERSSSGRIIICSSGPATSLDHLPVQEDHLLPTKTRGKKEHKPTEGRGGEGRQHRVKSCCLLRPVCLYIVQRRQRRTKDGRPAGERFAYGPKCEILLRFTVIRTNIKFVILHLCCHCHCAVRVNYV